MLCVPTVNVEVVRTAVVPAIATVPKAFVPSLKVMVPVAPEGTVAVKVTGMV